MVKRPLRGMILGFVLGMAAIAAIPDSARGGNATQAVSPEMVGVHARFLNFARQWLQRINLSYRFTPDNAELLDRDGDYVARYYRVEPETLSVKVKPSSHQSTPFVGVMRYVEFEYECPGQTPRAALSGPCAKVRGSRITEIFRYAEGRWLAE